MNLGAAVTGALPVMQAQGESLMTDSCTITRLTGERLFSETTGEYTQDTSTVYSGKCRVKPMPVRSDRQVEAGEQAVAVWPFVVSVPMTVTGIESGDGLAVTASLDPNLAGQALVVKAVASGSQITARRLGCDIQGG